MADGAASGATLCCPLCRAEDVAAFCNIDGKRYWRCQVCALTFLQPSSRLTPDAEYQHYLSHENEIHDPGYRKFLSKLANPLLDRLPVGASGLDYGCGPGPALAHMMREAGHQVALFDPFFAPDDAVLTACYDFITCTEVAEHFHDPYREFAGFDRMLKPGGWLGLMTCFQTDDAKFAGWHYRKDPTHVVFYKRETLAIIASRLDWQFESPTKDVALMRKPAWRGDQHDEEK